jgi:uncharacterized protein YdeI (YjbR/CyaY-like superfamily)
MDDPSTSSAADVPTPPSPNGKEIVAPRSRAEWRGWLERQPDRTEGVWVALPRRNRGVAGPTYEDAVEEALCFGWIDGQAARGDEHRTMLWFSPRRPGSVWARSNKERVERLVASGAMTERGMAVIDAAQADGSWSRYDDVDALAIHPDLEGAFDAVPAAREAFAALPPSQQKQHLWHIYEAKRPETRARRIAATISRLTE